MQMFGDICTKLGFYNWAGVLQLGYLYEKFSLRFGKFSRLAAPAPAAAGRGFRCHESTARPPALQWHGRKRRGPGGVATETGG